MKNPIPQNQILKSQTPQNHAIDIINSDIPTRAVDITDHEKPAVVTTPKGVLTALAAFLIWGFSPCILSYSKIMMRLKSLGIELFGRLSRFY